MVDPINNTRVIEAGCEGEDEVTTSNIYLAAACLTEGGKILHDKVDRSDPRRIKVCLRGIGLKRVVDAWWDGTSHYRRTFENLRDIREIIRPVEVRHAG